MQIKLKLIAAVSENLGIGLNGDLPWRLRKEMEYFTRMTTTTKNENRQNVVLMGYKTWESIPKKPLKNRINIVLSSKPRELEGGAILCSSFEDALKKLSEPSLKDKIEDVWVVGGAVVYKTAMESPHLHRVYLTRVNKKFDCDTYFPELAKDLVLIKDSDVPEGVQKEKDLEYVFEVYERKQ